LAWRAERALLMAWPALEESACGDWVARFGPGVSRRANSANPLRARMANIAADIEACAQLYRARGASALFRLPSIIEPGADEQLAHLNYTVEGDSLTLYADLAQAAQRDPDVRIAERPDPRWLAAIAAMNSHTQSQAAVYQRIVGSIVVPAGFASVQEEGALAALAYGAVHGGLLCLESVIVDARRRGRGHARRMLTALLAWGAKHGAHGVCLQVDARNTPALALYRSLGLRRELYRYHYRREPDAG
jgi:ribosomal protein S18 acetylase RimI-like enzyme